MKKLIFAAMAVFMLFAMVGCGGGDDPEPTPTPKPPASTTWTVTFDLDGGTWNRTSLTKTIGKGAEITQAWLESSVAVPIPTKQGYLFDKWVIKGTTPEADAIGHTVTADTTLKAVYEPYNPATDAEITFRDGYSAVTANPLHLIVLAGAKDDAKALGTQFPSATPTRDGYFFNKWVLQGATHNVAAVPEVVVTASAPTFDDDATVIAVWVEAVTITFNYNYEGGPATITRTIETGTAVGANWPAQPGRQGFSFNGWWNQAGSQQYTSTDTFATDITLYAKWEEDVLTLDGALELLYLTNGSYAIYQFDIPEGKTLADYEKVSFQFKLSAAGYAVWNQYGLRGARLYGVFDSTTTISRGDNYKYEGLEDVYFINLSGAPDHNTPYRITSPSTESIKTSLEADTWLLIEHALAGDGNTSNVPPQKPANQTGTVYFALGISCQDTKGGTDRSQSFVQLIKDIKLVPADVINDTPVIAQKPAATYAQFLAYNDPLVLEWRGEATEYNLEHWQELVPAMPEDTFDRGDPPADNLLSEVELGDYTYINSGNPTRQNGWVSFTEAGRANDQLYNKPGSSYTGPASTIAFTNFIEAWYLVLETTSAPIGGLRLAWMSDAGTWFENTFTNGEENDSVSITPDDVEDPTKYTIKILIPKALMQYGTYYQESKEWAALSVGYWGSGGGSLADLGITRAYLLVATEDKAPDAAGIGLSLTFTLGNAPESGALIDDVVLDESDDLTITTTAGLSDFRWYIDGEKNVETGDSLVISPVAAGDVIFVTVQAKKSGNWVSQTVVVTVESN
jgi:uncharacterized repeat protein (TIGR02543 family)